MKHVAQWPPLQRYMSIFVETEHTENQYKVTTRFSLTEESENLK